MAEMVALQARAKEIAAKYAEYNARKGQKEWGPKDRAMGFAVDVGELLEIVMAKEGMRSDVLDVDTKLAHELSDCLWSILVLADHYGVDLEKQFLQTMDHLEERVKR